MNLKNGDMDLKIYSLSYGKRMEKLQNQKIKVRAIDLIGGK
jgi:hypothetical protein